MRNGNGRCTTASSIRRVTRARTISRSTSRRARYSPKWSSIERSRPLTRWKWRLETALLPPGRTATACPTRVSFHARMALQANVNMFDSWRRRRILLVWSRPLSIAKRLANQHGPINAILPVDFQELPARQTGLGDWFHHLDWWGPFDSNSDKIIGRQNQTFNTRTPIISDGWTSISSPNNSKNKVPILFRVIFCFMLDFYVHVSPPSSFRYRCQLFDDGCPLPLL